MVSNDDLCSAHVPVANHYVLPKDCGHTPMQHVRIIQIAAERTNAFRTDMLLEQRDSYAHPEACPGRAWCDSL